jgi:hypothetical protein
MPIHDWTRLEPGDFHDFHQGWVVEICNALNGGQPPGAYMAMSEQVTGRPIPDVDAFQSCLADSSIDSAQPFVGIEHHDPYVGLAGRASAYLMPLI